MMRHRQAHTDRITQHRFISLGFSALLLATAGALEPTEAQPSQSPWRARRPDWNEHDSSDIFFKDAFREGLHGQRPLQAAGASATTNQLTQQYDSDSWDRIVSARTLEDEVKRITSVCRELNRRTSQLSGRASVAAAHRLNSLAAVFGVTANYDGAVRWKKVAASMAAKLQVWSNSLARGERAAIEEATWALDNLVRGNPPGDEAHKRVPLSTLVSRAALMSRLQEAIESGLPSGLANQRAFRREAAASVQHAEMIAVIARLLTLEGVEDANDEDYIALCSDLLTAASQLRGALERGEYEVGVQHFGAIKKSCAACHEMYRG